MIRLADKFNRLKTLLTNPSIPCRDESIEDTIKDIIGYCLLELEYRHTVKNLTREVKKVILLRDEVKHSRA